MLSQDAKKPARKPLVFVLKSALNANFLFSQGWIHLPLFICLILPSGKKPLETVFERVQIGSFLVTVLVSSLFTWIFREITPEQDRIPVF